MRKVIILQARLASSRFPQKVLAELGGKTVLAHIIERLKLATRPDEICVAIPEDKSENALADALTGMEVALTRGSGSDVLGRYIQAAYQTNADLIVRCTADNPLVSPEEIDRQLDELVADPALDYVITDGYPMGVTPESFTLKTLEKLDYLGKHHNFREHVTLYLRKHPGPFSIKTLAAPSELTWPDLKLSFDTPRDFELLKAIYERLYQPGVHLELKRVLNLLKDNPDLAQLGKLPVNQVASA